MKTCCVIDLCIFCCVERWNATLFKIVVGVCDECRVPCGESENGGNQVENGRELHSGEMKLKSGFQYLEETMTNKCWTGKQNKKLGIPSHSVKCCVYVCKQIRHIPRA